MRITSLVFIKDRLSILLIMQTLFISSWLVVGLCFAEDAVTKVDDFTIQIETPVIQTITYEKAIEQRDKLIQDTVAWEKQVVENRVNLSSMLTRLNAIITEADNLGVKAKPKPVEEVNE